jgi:hypothetical protein
MGEEARGRFALEQGRAAEEPVEELELKRRRE